MVRTSIIRRLALVSVLASAFVFPARADVEHGIASFERGEFSRAVAELEPPANAGDPRAQYLLGVMYLNGFVNPPRADTAAGWIGRAAEQGYLQAQTELARMYRSGDGVPQDLQRMVHWYSRAASQGDVGAQLFVADAYAYGIGVERDRVEAYKWYEIAVKYWGDLATRAQDVIAEEMTAEQIAEAIGLANSWLEADDK